MSHTPSPSPGAIGSRGTTFGEPTSGIVDQAQGTLGQVADQAQTTAGQVTQQATQQATSQLESQKARAVDSLVTVAQALRQTGQHLHQQDQATAGGYVEQAAERIEGLTNYLRARDVPQLVAETQDFARRQPGLFLTGAVALGFLGARFLMSSGRRAASQAAGYGGQRAPASAPGYGLGSSTTGYRDAGGYAHVSAMGASAGSDALAGTGDMSGISVPAAGSVAPPTTTASGGLAGAELADPTSADGPRGAPGPLEA